MTVKQQIILHSMHYYYYYSYIRCDKQNDIILIIIMNEDFVDSYVCSNPDGAWTEESKYNESVLHRHTYPTIPTNKYYEAWLTRRTTFVNWPESTTGQNADELASAGFAYTGYADTVKCVSCFKRFMNWKPSDCPFLEHIRQR